MKTINFALMLFGNWAGIGKLQLMKDLRWEVYMGNLIGVDIGGTKCAIIIGRNLNKSENKCIKEISILDRIAFPTKTQRGAWYTLDRILENILIILNRNDPLSVRFLTSSILATILSSARVINLMASLSTFSPFMIPDSSQSAFAIYFPKTSPNPETIIS